MFRKNYFVPLLFIAVFLVGSVSVFAQTTTTGGTVFKKNAEGVDVPFASAKIDCYRVDIKQSCRSTTSDSKGKFTFIGIPSGAKVFLAVSGTGIAPQVVPVTKLGVENLVVSVEDGDGSVPTEDRVRESARAYAANTGELTEAQKKEIEELEKKRVEIASKNVKARQNNEKWDTLLKEGKTAFNEGNMDTAIEKFNAGYEVDKTFVGAAPVFLNNKASALNKRAAKVYNEAVKSKVPGEKEKGIEAAAKDLGGALESVIMSHSILKTAKPSEINNQESYKSNKKGALEVAKDSLSILTQIQANLGNYIADKEDAVRVVKIYKDVLEMLPDSHDALSGLSMTLYNSSLFREDPNEKQESVNYMAHYLKVAPKDHRSRVAVTGLLDHLKNNEKMKPQKIK